MKVATVKAIDQFLLRPIRTLFTKLRSLPRYLAWGLVLFFSVLAWPFESTRIQHQLVDAETGKAVTNAVGVYYVQSHAGSFGGGGGKQTNRVLVEARADNLGMLDFSPQWIAPCLPGVCLHYIYPHIYIFAPGYLPKDLFHSTDPGPRGLWEALEWPANGSVVKLERPLSEIQYVNKVDDLQLRMSEVWAYAVDDGVQCDWDRIPQMLTSIHMESWYRKSASSSPYSDEFNPSRLGRTLVSIRYNELNAGEPHRSRIASCKKVLDVLNKTPIRCKDGSSMKDSRWEYVPLPSLSSGALNVFGSCIDAKAPIALIAENVQGKVRTQPQRLGLLFNGCLKFEEYGKPTIPAQSEFNIPAPTLRLSPLEAYKVVRASTKLQCVEYGLLADSDYYYFYDRDLEHALQNDGRFDKKKFPDKTYAVNGMTGEFVNIAPSSAQGNF